MKLNQKNRVGVSIFALLVIVRYLYHLSFLLGASGFTEYRFSFIDLLSDQMIRYRYAFSIGYRMAAILAAMGLFFRKEGCRKIMIGMCWFNVLTVYWKHPFRRFLSGNLVKMAERFPFPGKIFASFDLTDVQLAWTWIIYLIFIEIVFNIAMIYCLTRPSSKEFFRNKTTF